LAAMMIFFGFPLDPWPLWSGCGGRARRAVVALGDYKLGQGRANGACSRQSSRDFLTAWRCSNSTRSRSSDPSLNWISGRKCADAHGQSAAPPSATAPKQTTALSVCTARAWRDPAAVAGGRYRLRHRRARLTYERRDHDRFLKENQLHPEQGGQAGAQEARANPSRNRPIRGPSSGPREVGQRSVEQLARGCR
jgi:hypothetical protein